MGKAKAGEKQGDTKDGDSELVQCPVCNEWVKYLRREAKHYGRKSCAMDVIHQHHKITMQKPENMQNL